MLEKDELIINRYVLQGQIKVSSTTETWISYDSVLERLVELEFLQKGLINNNRIMQLFHNQSIVSANLIHPNLIPVVDYAIHNTIPFNVRLHINAERLYEMVRQYSRMPLDQILSISQQIALSLDYLHSVDVVHRNVKSSNIMVGSENRAYLGGLNVLHYGQAEDLITEEGVVIGTAQYISPESFLGETSEGHNLPPRDIYSFGVILFEALTGTIPYKIEHGGIREWREIHSYEDIPLVSTYRLDLPKGLDLVIRRLLAKKPEDRYQTATAAVDGLYKVFYSGQSNIEGKIFMSYARKDREYVHSLAKELRRIGLDIWIDQDIEPGSNWDEAIENGLNACDMMLLITTESSMSSEYVTHEWSYFMGGGKPVYPFIPQELMPTNIHPRLSRVQHIVGTDDMLNNVARIVDMLAGGNPKKLA